MFSKKMFNTKKTIEVTSEDCTFECLGTNNLATIKDKLMYTSPIATWKRWRCPRPKSVVTPFLADCRFR